MSPTVENTPGTVDQTLAVRPGAMQIAESRGLDLLNTVGMLGPVRSEWLSTGEDLLDWMLQTKMISSQDARSIRESTAPHALDEAARKARGLREWFRGFATQHIGEAVTVDALEALSPLNEVLQRGRTHVTVGLNSGHSETAVRLQVQRTRNWSSIDNLLSILAEEVAISICETDFTHLKKCEGPACSMMFLDTTKRQSRRWCSMSVCGNRVKQAAHRARARKSPGSSGE